MNKKFTWGQLRDFCNALPEQHLNRPVIVLNSCRENQDYVEPHLSEVLYVHSDDNEDVYDELTFNMQVKLGEIDPADYRRQEAGIPFLTDECDGEGWNPAQGILLMGDNGGCCGTCESDCDKP